jgi:hypothetical protein
MTRPTFDENYLAKVREFAAKVAAQMPDPAQIARDEQEARDFTADQRKKHAEAGDAMPDGSYPIITQEDLNSAWDLRGRSKHYSKEQIEAHCRAMAKKHGLTMPSSAEPSAKADVAKGLIPDPESILGPGEHDTPTPTMKQDRPGA